MDVQALLSPDTAPALGESRARVLDLLRGARTPLGVQDVAERTGLHPNTARFHLEGLADAGFVARERQPRDTPGRPSTLYRASDSAPAGQRRYRLLAEILTGLIAATMPQPREAATEAGREWGGYLAEEPPPSHRFDAGHAIAALVDLLEAIGFVPEAPTGEGDVEIRLRACPFREVAEQHRDVICSLHLGLMQGALARMRAPLSVDRLQPFAEPSVCIARLAAESEPPRPAAAVPPGP